MIRKVLNRVSSSEQGPGPVGSAATLTLTMNYKLRVGGTSPSTSLSPSISPSSINSLFKGCYISYSVLKVLVISCPLISAVRWRGWAEVNKQVNTKLLIMIGLETKLCIALLPPLTQLWQDNWIPTWKWFECFLQLLRPPLFDWAGLQTPPEERGGRLQQGGGVGHLVWHLYTWRGDLVVSAQHRDLYHLYPEWSCSPPSPSGNWNFCCPSSPVILFCPPSITY